MLTVEELKRGLRPILAADAGASASGAVASGAAGAGPAESLPAAWFDALALRLEDGRLVVGFPHSYFARWFSAHKRAGFESALARCFPDVPAILYEDAASRPAPRSGQRAPLPQPGGPARAAGAP